MRAIGWDEVQLDASSRQGYPFPHELGVMITRVVQENMDERQHWIERLDRLQQPDRRGGVDGQGLDHPGLPGLQVDRAVNVDALTPARLLDRELLLARRPAADGPRGMGRMYGVRKQHGLVFAQGIQQLFVALNESLLLFFVELARDDIGFVIFEPQAMQQRDQSRPAFVNDVEFILDPCADLARRTRQRRAYPRLQIVLLLHTQIACAPAHIEAGDAFDPALLEELTPAPDRVVIKEQRIGDLLTAPP